jgi:hypothetical protein
MVTEEEIAELMKTPEGMQILRSMMEDQDEGEAMTDAASPTGGALGQVSDSELEQLRAASPTGGALGQIGASPDTPRRNSRLCLLRQSALLLTTPVRLAACRLK